MLKVSDVEEFVRRDYETKDVMHNLSHIRRILRVAQRLALDHTCDSELLMLGAYFHGIIYSRGNDVSEFLKRKGVSQDRIDKAVQIAWESQKESKPETVEGIILHDAHLIEGGKTFLITKSLVTGTARGQTLEETISYIERNILGKFKCYLPEAQKIYKKKEKFAEDFLSNLKNNL
jgi:uncharacterized protein